MKDENIQASPYKKLVSQTFKVTEIKLVLRQQYVFLNGKTINKVRIINYG